MRWQQVPRVCYLQIFSCLMFFGVRCFFYERSLMPVAPEEGLMPRLQLTDMQGR
jgi:hypothetical protein